MPPLIGTRIDWAPYFEYAIETVYNGGTIDQDWCKGIADGSVVMTTLNEKICAKGTAEKVAEVEKALKDGTLQVFDTSKFTVKGETVTHAFALDTDGDFTPRRRGGRVRRRFPRVLLPVRPLLHPADRRDRVAELRLRQLSLSLPSQADNKL